MLAAIVVVVVDPMVLVVSAPVVVVSSPTGTKYVVGEEIKVV